MMRFNEFLVESDPQPHALKGVKKVCATFKKEHGDKHYKIDYVFKSPTVAVITLTIDRWLSDDEGDVQEYNSLVEDLRDIAEKHGDALKVEDGDNEFAGEIVRAVATQMIKRKENLSWELFISKIQLELTYGVRGK